MCLLVSCAFWWDAVVGGFYGGSRKKLLTEHIKSGRKISYQFFFLNNIHSSCCCCCCKYGKSFFCTRPTASWQTKSTPKTQLFYELQFIWKWKQSQIKWTLISGRVLSVTIIRRLSHGKLYVSHPESERGFLLLQHIICNAFCGIKSNFRRQFISIIWVTIKSFQFVGALVKLNGLKCLVLVRRWCLNERPARLSIFIYQPTNMGFYPKVTNPYSWPECDWHT